MPWGSIVHKTRKTLKKNFRRYLKRPDAKKDRELQKKAFSNIEDSLLFNQLKNYIILSKILLIVIACTFV